MAANIALSPVTQDGAFPSGDQESGHTARRATQFNCSIMGCPGRHFHMTKGTLTRHVAQHAQAGEGIPQSLLDIIAHTVCIPCRHLVKIGRCCPFCPRTPTSQTALANTETATSTTTNQPYYPSPQPRTHNATPLQTPFTSPRPDLQPSLDDILRCQAPTIRHIPAARRHTFAKTLGDIL